MVIGRTFSTSRTHRDVIHAQGQIGSNQKSIGVSSAAAGSAGWEAVGSMVVTFPVLPEIRQRSARCPMPKQRRN